MNDLNIHYRANIQNQYTQQRRSGWLWDEASLDVWAVSNHVSCKAASEARSKTIGSRCYWRKPS
ncbi:hypothetical protein DPMN_046386 [Dreissena polymorpha]|uniref:Uncharacterized protein n=1 Tax=Dreissena polymorpha TaxID=45954 RepID=A0A9D4I0T9_DREPO|nr:hypothetical protein DPMN_046386 [Dreissena polymorpha]